MNPARLGWLLTAGVASSACASPPQVAARCDDGHPQRHAWSVLKADGFGIESRPLRHAEALTMLACFDHPDPTVRDGIVFTGWSTWLRGGQLDAEHIVAAVDFLLPALEGVDDALGLRRPFAALLLSELARADRMQDALPAATRQRLRGAAVSYLRGIADYRDFDPAHGWRHAVAHAADLILQLGVSPYFDHDLKSELLDVLIEQAAPTLTRYTAGEPDRLVRAFYFISSSDPALTKVGDAALARLLDPAPFSGWNAMLESVEGIARRHNAQAFLHALGFAYRIGGLAEGPARAEQIDAMLRTTHGG